MIVPLRLRIIFLLFAAFGCSAVAQAGVSGTGGFENDDAREWFEKEFKTRGMPAVLRAIEIVARSDDYLLMPQACRAIAACEVLAAVQGRPSPDLPEEVAALARKFPRKVHDALRRTARDAIDRVTGPDSETNDVWKQAGDDYQKWQKSVRDLKARL
ncbi:MAG TPA: DUF4259 domain-containing protein [Lacunisphaera sp.]|nr:DUF4259 domain-containing protein [Lacunisphaera sp.]